MTDKEERKLKLIWDFHGPDSARIAEHHAKHLREFASSNKTAHEIVGVEALGAEHHTAYLVVDESEMKPVRDALKPHRGQVYKPE